MRGLYITTTWPLVLPDGLPEDCELHYAAWFDDFLKKYQQFLRTSSDANNLLADELGELCKQKTYDLIWLDGRFRGFVHNLGFLRVPVSFADVAETSLRLLPDTPTYFQQLAEETPWPLSQHLHITLLPAFHQEGKEPFSWSLNQLYNLRISGDTNPIVLLSFTDSHAIKPYDKMGHLAGAGISLYRLPAEPREFGAFLQEFASSEWNHAAILQQSARWGWKMVQHILRKWQHGARQDVVNVCLNPLRMALLQDNAALIEKYRQRFEDFYVSDDFQTLSAAKRFDHLLPELKPVRAFVINCTDLHDALSDGDIDLQYKTVESTILSFQNLSHHVQCPPD
jgi:hypothetical protein